MTTEAGSLTVTVEHRIGCSPEHLWEALSRPSALETMHPFVARHRTPDGGVTVGARDTVVYHSGIRIERHFVEHEAGRRGAVEVEIYDPTGNRLGQATTEMRVSADGDGCRMEVAITTRALPGDARVMQEEMTRQYLGQMLRGFSYFCETGEPVRRNQFGAHPFYSPDP